MAEEAAPRPKKEPKGAKKGKGKRRGCGPFLLSFLPDASGLAAGLQVSGALTCGRRPTLIPRIPGVGPALTRAPRHPRGLRPLLPGEAGPGASGHPGEPGGPEEENRSGTNPPGRGRGGGGGSPSQERAQGRQEGEGQASRVRPLSPFLPDASGTGGGIAGQRSPGPADGGLPPDPPDSRRGTRPDPRPRHPRGLRPLPPRRGGV